jgi:hypothetical protein
LRAVRPDTPKPWPLCRLKCSRSGSQRGLCFGWLDG